MSKYGLVLEGGAMRGLFTAGALDVFMENGITFDAAVGVSAGAAFGCNIKSNQIGRALRYNVNYCKDKRYCSWRSLLLTGNMYGADFCYHELPEKLDIFDHKAFSENKMDFYVVATNVETGNPEFYKCTDGKNNDLEWIRASASMPLVSRVVEIDGKKLLDGGISCSIPTKFFLDKGYEKNVVITTQPRKYLKKKNLGFVLAKIVLRKYPEFIKAMKNRHLVYNAEREFLWNEEKKGNCIVICPDEPLPVRKIEHNQDNLRAAYNEGRKKALEKLDEIKAFLN